MRLPSRSGLGQSSVGLVYAVRCPHSEEPTLGGYDKRPKFMYLYFMPFHHHINLGSTVLYFFFVLYSCRFPLYSTTFESLSPFDAPRCYLFGYRFPQAFFLTIFYIHNLASPCYYLRRNSRTVILGSGYVYLYIHFSLLHDCTASFHLSWALNKVLETWD